MAQRNIIIFLGSVRPVRMADRVLTLVRGIAESEGLSTTVFDPREMPFEMVKTPLHFMKSPADAPDWLKEANQTIVDADGFLILTAEYNSTLPPGLTNMMDHFAPASYRHRPVGLVGYSMGNFGGMRALSALRSFVVEFGMLPTPTNVPIPLVHTAITEEGKCSEERISKNIQKLSQELGWYADALKNHKKVVNPKDHSFG